MTRSIIAIAIAFAAGAFASTTLAQEINPYSGYKLPPTNVSAEMKYERKFMELLGSKMACIDIETVSIGNRLHDVQETHPVLIGSAISDGCRWLEANKQDMALDTRHI